MNENEISESAHETALVLANAGELVAAIITKVAGNDISTAVNGSVLTREMIQNLTYQTIERAVVQQCA